MTDLIKKIESKECCVGVVGLGYVGVPLCLRISEAGFCTIGFDIDPRVVNSLNEGKSLIKHIPDNDIKTMRDIGFTATDDFSSIGQCDVIVICVPTPLNKSREPDLSYVENTMEQMSPYFRENQLLCLESTTWPGTTKEVLSPFISRSGLCPGENFFLAYSPEREDPGNANFTTRSIPKVVGGLTHSCLLKAQLFYSQIIDTVVPVSSSSAAEMVKLLENIHRAVNIGLVNEMKVVADAMGLDIFEIINAAKTKPFGFTAYYPGPGIGGHCIPIDPFYLTWKAREFGLHTRFIELAGEINAAMPQYVVDKLVSGLNSIGKSVKGSNILLLGIAYKSDVDDCRESPSFEVMNILREWGATLSYSDPNVDNLPKMRNYDFELASVDLTPDTVGFYDAVVLLTAHSDFDYKMIGENARLIIDTRGKFAKNQSVVNA